MAKLEVRDFGSPDEVKEFEKVRTETIRIGDATVVRNIYQPGWRWSKHLRPIAKTSSCQVSHLLYLVSGTMHVVMDDGTERDIKAGEVTLIPPGHDGWVVGNEKVVAVGF
jgi:quercetin dioxygenase-like cupin family protein